MLLSLTRGCVARCLPMPSRPLVRRLPGRHSGWYPARCVDTAEVLLRSLGSVKSFSIAGSLSRCLGRACVSCVSVSPRCVRTARRSTILYKSGSEALSTATKASLMRLSNPRKKNNRFMWSSSFSARNSGFCKGTPAVLPEPLYFCQFLQSIPL